MIHRYRSNGYNIVLDIYSGAIHVVSDVIYDSLNLLEEWAEDIIDNGCDDNTRTKGVNLLESLDYSYEVKLEAIEEIIQLIIAEQLYTKDSYKEYIDSFGDRESIVKALCLHIAHDCNLRCQYCFADEGEYHGKRELMTSDIGCAALDLLVRSSGNRMNLEVDFFGGEPLMNMDVVKDIVEYGRGLEKKYNKKFRFTLTTNATLLTEEIMDYLNEEMSNVVLSIDGRREVNDKMRPFSGGIGSYDIIMPKIKRFVDKRCGKKYYIRGTFSRYNIDFSEDVRHLVKEGFKEISIEPVVSDDTEGYSITSDEINLIYEEYDKLSKDIIKWNREGIDINFFHFMIDLEQGPCVAKRLSGCGSGTEYLAVTPRGDLYPCHQFVGMDEFIMGNVWDGITERCKVLDFKKINVYTKDECRDCFAKFYCSGGCAANSYKFKGNINSVYDIGCELERKRVECAIMIQVDKALGA